MQGAQENFITIAIKLKAFEEKLILWNETIEALKALSEQFVKYFPNLNVAEMEWVVNPFISEVDKLQEDLQENLIDLKNDLVFKRIFAEKELLEFWISLKTKFPG